MTTWEIVRIRIFKLRCNFMFAGENIDTLICLQAFVQLIANTNVSVYPGAGKLHSTGRGIGRFGRRRRRKTGDLNSIDRSTALTAKGNHDPQEGTRTIGHKINGRSGRSVAKLRFLKINSDRCDQLSCYSTPKNIIISWLNLIQCVVSLHHCVWHDKTDFLPTHNKIIRLHLQFTLKQTKFIKMD